MRILELLLPPGINDKSLSPQKSRDLGGLQARMNKFVDKICDPKTSKQYKEVLKTQLKKEYDKFNEVINSISETPENINEILSKTDNLNRKQDKKNWEWYSEQKDFAEANFVVGNIPYSFYIYTERNRVWEVEFKTDSFKMPSLVKSRYGLTNTGNEIKVFSIVIDIMRSFLDRYISVVDVLRFSAEEPSRQRLYKHIVKRLLPKWKLKDFGTEFEVIKPNVKVYEAVYKVPLTNDDFKAIKELMNHPIPAIVAPIYLQDLIEDDEFTTLLKEIEEKTPNRDVRPFIAEWFKRIMPDQLSRFRDDAQTYKQKLGNMSPIHGYDPQMYKGSTEPVTGDAFGRR